MTYRKNGVGYTPSPTEVHTSERHDSDFPPFLLALAPILLVFILTMVLQLGFGWRSTQAAITSLLAGTIFLISPTGTVSMSLANLPPSPRAWSAASSRLPIPPSSWVLLAWSLLPPPTQPLWRLCSKSTPTLTSLQLSLWPLSVPSVRTLIGGVSTFSATLGQTILGMGGVDAGALHRLTLAASTTFDSMPHNGSLNVTMGVMGLTHKDVYKNILCSPVSA